MDKALAWRYRLGKAGIRFESDDSRGPGLSAKSTRAGGLSATLYQSVASVLGRRCARRAGKMRLSRVAA